MVTFKPTKEDIYGQSLQEDYKFYSMIKNLSKATVLQLNKKGNQNFDFENDKVKATVRNTLRKNSV